MRTWYQCHAFVFFDEHCWMMELACCYLCQMLCCYVLLFVLLCLVEWTMSINALLLLDHNPAPENSHVCCCLVSQMLHGDRMSWLCLIFDVGSCLLVMMMKLDDEACPAILNFITSVLRIHESYRYAVWMLAKCYTVICCRLFTVDYVKHMMIAWWLWMIEFLCCCCCHAFAMLPNPKLHEIPKTWIPIGRVLFHWGLANHNISCAGLKRCSLV